jgi:type VI secretion system secreted protein VgrG
VRAAFDPVSPARTTPKPLIQGPQTAVVVGVQGEEIDVDRHARVRLHFHGIVRTAEREELVLGTRRADHGRQELGTVAHPRVGRR